DRRNDVGDILVRIFRIHWNADITFPNLNGPGAALPTITNRFLFGPVEGWPACLHRLFLFDERFQGQEHRPLHRAGWYILRLHSGDEAIALRLAGRPEVDR